VSATHIWGEDAAIKSTVCSDRLGFMFNPGLANAKPLHPLLASQLPVYKISSDATWSAKSNFEITFHDFVSDQLACGKK
jgi:hypothetical protein